MKQRKPRRERSPWKYFQGKKAVLIVYTLLRFLVLTTLILQLINENYQNAFLCLLTLVLFIMPSALEKKLNLQLPTALEIVLLFFIFAAEILGEIQEFYLLVPHWDTWLHTINGFLFAAVGFCMVDLLNQSERVSLHLSPVYMAVAAFGFSMTIGVLWEFFEWGMDCFFGLDMQKDTVVHSISSVTLNPAGHNDPNLISGITDVILVLSDGSQVNLGLGGYLDIGLMDTMKDLLVNLIGAVVFCVFGYFYVKTRGKGRLASMFIPKVVKRPKE